MYLRRSVVTIVWPLALVALLWTTDSATTAQNASSVASPVAAGGLQFDVEFWDTLLAALGTGLQFGDRVIVNDLLLLDGQEIGHNGGVCTVVDPEGDELFCAVTWSLPDGTISTQFLNTPAPEKVFAITGGTGAYGGAQGVGTLIEHGDGTGTVSFQLTD